MYANRFFTFIVILAVAAVIALTVREAVVTSAVALDPGAQEAQRLQRSRAADAARWAAMGDYYGKLNGSQSLARGRTADAARWMAVGEYYQRFGGAALNLLRSRAAETSRWTAMAKYYQKRAKAEAQNLARARAADAARWTAMGEYYAQFGASTP